MSNSAIRRLYEQLGFDLNEALLYCDHDETLLMDLIGVFVEILPSQYDKLRQAFEEHALEDAEQITHTLKSSAATIGAQTLSNLCQDCNHLLKANTLPSAELQQKLLTTLLAHKDALLHSALPIERTKLPISNQDKNSLLDEILEKSSTFQWINPESVDSLLQLMRQKQYIDQANALEIAFKHFDYERVSYIITEIRQSTKDNTNNA
ncbi:Hpt domain-containing protein [Nitrincola nitratireducens]|uniref:TMAO reductase sytem sensor TorS n=1 Tax=Nitrincola nitratireducens TaxID=1229521 RepID=W9UYS5_9GAMM|nr:Hpt domain-containing protein [Nitrincola nitratireducens]EXJ12244.1 TMAO reductase sytem sensor TorS [Nitrincola nitratireducens]